MPKTLKLVEAKPSTALEALGRDYLAHKRGKGLSPRSMDLTANVLEAQFLPWSAKEGITQPDQLTQKVIDKWQAYLLEDHRTPAGNKLARESVRTYVRTLGSFIKWAQSEDVVAAKVQARQPKRERRLLETLDRDDINRIENTADSERDKVLVRLLADSGIRLGELLGLRGEDLNEQGRERYIKVRGKGSRDRLVPVKPELFVRLRKLATRGRNGSSSDRIFVTNRKSARTGQYEPLAPRSVQNMLRFTAEAAGIGRKVHPHLFRHSFATRALRGGMNPLQLQRIMGHADLSMIAGVYSHLTASDSYNAMIELLRKDVD
jgi:integrase/recombinase XerD